MKPSASQRRIGAFRLAAVRAILCACPDRAPFAPKTVIGAPRSAACLTIYLSRMRLGRASAVRSNSLFNHDIIDLYNRVPVGSPVVVLQEPGPVADLQERGSMTDASEPDVAYGPGPDVGPVFDGAAPMPPGPWPEPPAGPWRESWPPPLLHLLHQGPAGRDRL